MSQILLLLFPRSFSTKYFYFLSFQINYNFTFSSAFKPVKWSESHSVMSDSLQPHGLYSPWNSPGQNTGVGSLSFLQGIFPTQESNQGLLHCRRILHQLSYLGSPIVHPTISFFFWIFCFLTKERLPLSSSSHHSVSDEMAFL